MTGGTIVVLGPTGRNFGAGMSGGAAYVLDFDPANLNPAAAAAGDLLATTPEGSDIDELRALLQRHVDFTGSEVAQAILETSGFERFTKLVPRSYARMTVALESAAAKGLDITNSTVWNEIMEEAHRG